MKVNIKIAAFVVPKGLRIVAHLDHLASSIFSYNVEYSLPIFHTNINVFCGVWI
jgi:hypothetical protein